MAGISAVMGMECAETSVGASGLGLVMATPSVAIAATPTSPCTGEAWERGWDDEREVCV